LARLSIWVAGLTVCVENNGMAFGRVGWLFPQFQVIFDDVDTALQACARSRYALDVICVSLSDQVFIARYNCYAVILALFL
jgi:hypothetical protein